MDEFIRHLLWSLAGLVLYVLVLLFAVALCQAAAMGDRHPRKR